MGHGMQWHGARVSPLGGRTAAYPHLRTPPVRYGRVSEFRLQSLRPPRFDRDSRLPCLTLAFSFMSSLCIADLPNKLLRSIFDIPWFLLGSDLPIFLQLLNLDKSGNLQKNRRLNVEPHLKCSNGVSGHVLAPRRGGTTMLEMRYADLECQRYLNVETS